MAGLIPPSSGSVVLQGKPVMGPREDIGMMFQQATLFPWRTVMENVVLPLEIRDGKKAARAAHGRARELLSMAGLERFHHLYPNELSGGMAHRASLCRMLFSDPSVLPLDALLPGQAWSFRSLMQMVYPRVSERQHVG